MYQVLGTMNQVEIRDTKCKLMSNAERRVLNVEVGIVLYFNLFLEAS
jgi:hypothetical protein